MTREEARLTLQANVIYACEVAKFSEATIGLVEEALDMAIEALKGGDAEWIPCDTSGMPPEGEAVLLSDGNRIWIDETVAWWGDKSDWIGTAWMPLPKPYKGGDKE